MIARLSSPVVNRIFVPFCCLAVLAVVVRYCFVDARDPFKCGALLNEGRWLDLSSNTSIVPSKWQPPGCMVQKYTSADISKCLANRRALYIGDSTIREIFWASAKALDKEADPTSAEKHTDITFEREGVKLEFIWDPYLNGSRLQTELSSYNGAGGKTGDSAALMLMGAGLWHARNEKVNGLKKWKDNIDEVAAHMRAGRKTTDISRSDFLLLSPVLVPVYERLRNDRREAITPDEVAAMNEYLQQLSSFQGVDVMWAFSQMTDNLPQTFDDSGLHVVKSIAERQADALLNLRCNSQISTKYPYDKTCCNKYSPPNHVQWFGLVFVLAIIPAIRYFKGKDNLTSSRIQAPAWFPSEQTTQALLAFGLAVVYCFYADRTQVFNKAHKYYSDFDFSLLSTISIALGLVTFRRSSTTASDQPFLNRDQTDEWKGWMQFAILIYHYTGASKIAWIYCIIRVTVASYLFMTGYGHTIYFYKKKDYSFKRVAGVLIRLNLLSCVLPYMMGTDYLFYYFAPLVSYWFLVVYATMRIGSKYNTNTRFLVAKVVFSGLISAFITQFPGILEFVFTVFSSVAKTSWDVQEWRFRVSLDLWIVYIGMLIAILSIKLSEGLLNTSRYWTPIRRTSILLSAIFLPLFFYLQSQSSSKYTYNKYHPYVSFIPIFSFIILRNATPQLRNAYSEIFAWLGKCSLETFTLQFHIWMAADTRGLLDLGVFNNRVLNFCVITAVFLFISHCVARATGELTSWIMGGQQHKSTPLPPARLPTTTHDTVITENSHGEEEAMIVKSEAEIGLADLEAEAEAVALTEMRTNENDEAAMVAASEKRVVAAAGGRLGMYWRNLKVRCFVCMLVLWVLNVTY